MRNPREGDLLRVFGRRIAQLRKDRALTQTQLAEIVDMSVVMIAYIETGKRWVRLSTLNKIAQALEVEIADLFSNVS